MPNLKKPFLMGTAAAGAALCASVFFSILVVHAACTNPSTIPSGFAGPCPVFSLSSTTVTQAQTLTLSATPQAGTDYIYTTAYVSQGTSWNPYTSSGNNAYPSYSSALASLALSGTQLSALALGTHYAVVWDWLWDQTAQCYKGPGLNQCNTGAWRVQSFSLTSSATPTPTATPIYTYSQSSYYAYSQAAYASAPVVSVSPTSLTFPSQQVGTTSAVQYTNLTNTGNATLTFGTSTFTGDFAFAGVGSCGSTLSVGASCTFSIKFTPTAAGTRTGNLTINSDASNSPQMVALVGTGVTSYAYSQSSYCTYSQSSYYAYSQSAYTSGTAYYISPSGSDSNSGTSQSAPFKTFAHAISLLQPGYTLYLLNGTYTGSAGTGYPSINCAGGAHNGTATAPITIQAQNERQAFIKGDGSGEAFNMLNCSYWNIIGLHVENADNGGNTSSGDVMQFYNDDHLAIRRNIAARPNRCANVHALLVYNTSNSLVEENEVYYFHRWGIIVYSDTTATGNEVRRNYANARAYPDSSSVCTAYPNGGTVFGVGPYWANNNIFENNVTEDSSLYQLAGINVEASASNNGFLGNVSGKNQLIGFRIDPHSGYPQSTGNTFTNNVSVLPSQIGVWSRSTQSSFDHQSAFGTSSGLEGMASDVDSSETYPSYKFIVNNSMLQNFSTGYGYYVSNTANNTFSFDHDNNFNNAVNYQPNQNVTNPNTSNPSFGSCYLWVPASSPLKGAGSSGSDMGANVLYQYQSGALTSNRLWDPATGAPLFKGATVAGLNDVAGSSLFDIANRLNINQNGCALPVGY